MRRFQFHTGSIKSSDLSGEDENATACFNSILVRLKATLYHFPVFVSHMFQFHTGSIKRVIICKKCYKKYYVSIPYWFD